MSLERGNDMNSLLFITEEKSYLMTSFREQLERLAYHVVAVPADTDAINAVKEPVSGVLIFVDEGVNEQLSSLNFLKDWTIANGIPIFALGTRADIEDLKSVIPAHLIRREFMRPLSTLMSEMVRQLDEFIRRKGMRKKILAVDDSGSMLRTVKGWLENKYSVFLANSGAMAIKYLALNRPDLVLLDYEMPVVDGRKLLEMIRTESEFKDIPVIFLTVKDDRESIMSVSGLKPDGYLAKTLEPSAIVAAIDEFFEKQKAKM